MSPHDPRLTAVLEHAWNILRDGHAAALSRTVALLESRSVSAPRRGDREAAREIRDVLDRARPRLESAFPRLLRLHAEGVDTPASSVPAGQGLDWDALTLVDDAKVESDIALARLTQQFAACAEWEFRELGAHLGSLCGMAHLDIDRTPIRPTVIARALHGAVVESVATPTAREPVLAELSGPLLRHLPELLASILASVKAQGVRPVGMAIRPTDWAPMSGLSESADELPDSGRRAPTRTGASRHGPRGHVSVIDEPLHFGPPGRAGEFDPDTDFDPGHASRHAPGSGDARYDPRPEPARRSATDRNRPADTRRPPREPTSDRPPGMTSGAGVDRGVGRRAGPGSRGGSNRCGHGGETSHATAAGISQALGLTAMLRRLVASADTGGLGESALAEEDAAAGHGHESAGPLTRAMRQPANLIRLHQAELQQASGGSLDHLVIEIVGTLFDQVLSDTRVPPQMARQIARLQLPVLRVTLLDPSFFASRRHPVRQFINRLASLAVAFDDLSDGPGRTLLQRVVGLVQEIVDGEFEQVDLYGRKLRELEQFVTQSSQDTLEKQVAVPSLLSSKEAQLRVQLRYRSQLQTALEPLALPPFLHDFLTQVWSQALVDAHRDAGKEPDRLARWRSAARDLVISIQPKGAPAQRKRFLVQLPGLMRELQAGLQHVGWPQAAQQRFLATLRPAQAEALRGPPMSELDHNLLVKQLDDIFAAPLPVGPGAPPLSVPLSEAPDPCAGVAVFTESEAQRLGWVPDQTLPVAGPVRSPAPPPVADAAEPLTGGETLRLDIDFEVWGDSPPDQPVQVGPVSSLALPDPVLPLARDAGLDIELSTADAVVDPSHGPNLADHLTVGIAYEMLLKTRWKRVRLSHVSPGRTFFVFTHGHRHQETLTMSARMVRHVCATGRMRTVENACLIERASERARDQLASIGQTAKAEAARTPTTLH
jgi:hypothetical protein